MNEEQIADIWNLFKEYCDKKQIDVVAERFIDLIADYGTTDETLKECFGVDADLDSAISYYLEIDAEISYEDDEDEWDE